MRNIYLIFSLFCFSLVFLSGCQKDAEVLDGGYIEFGGVKLAFQADAADTYKFTLDGDTIKTSTSYIFPRHKTTALLRAFKNNETKPILEEEIAIVHRKMIEMVQMPGSDISIMLAGNEEDPSSENKVKVRFFYNNIEGWGKSIKVDVWVRAGRRGTPVFTNISLELKEGILSDYIELDLNYLFPENTGGPMFSSNIYDTDTKKLLVDHSSIGIGTRIFDYDATKGFKNNYKLVTTELIQLKDNKSIYLFNPIDGLCISW